jgi:hypothetical protein
MKGLPFLIQPKKKFEPYRLGTEDTGFLEIERRGYLTVSEKAFVDAVTQSSDGVASMIRLANRASGKYGVTVEAAYTGVMAAMGQGAKTKLSTNIQQDFADDISEVISAMTDAAQKRSIACATILIQSRINKDWSVDDTLEMDPELLEEFVRFYDMEDQRDSSPQDVDLENPEEEDLREIVGKSSEENGDS